MSRTAICLFLLVFASAPAAQDASSPSLDYLELVPFSYAEKLEDDPAGAFSREGEGVALRFGWQANEILAVRGSYQVTSTLPETGGTAERTDRMHELSMAFVAPLARSASLLIELGLAGETQSLVPANGQESNAKSASDVFAAIEFRARFNGFELGIRSAGQTFHNARHQSHAVDMRLHVSENLALGAHFEAADRDLRDTQRAGLGLQFKF